MKNAMLDPRCVVSVHWQPFCKREVRFAVRFSAVVTWQQSDTLMAPDALAATLVSYSRGTAKVQGIASSENKNTICETLPPILKGSHENTHNPE